MSPEAPSSPRRRGLLALDAEAPREQGTRTLALSGSARQGVPGQGTRRLGYGGVVTAGTGQPQQAGGWEDLQVRLGAMCGARREWASNPHAAYKTCWQAWRAWGLFQMTHQFDVSRHAFTPMPAVDSTVLTLVPFTVLPWPACDEPWFFRIVKSAFAHRRKTLRVNLLTAFPTAFTKTALATIFTDLGLSEHVRAQELHVRQFVQLAEALYSLAPEKSPSP